MGASVVRWLVGWLLAAAQSPTVANEPLIGPFVEITDDRTLRVWARAPDEGVYTLEINGPVADGVERLDALAQRSNDLVVRWSTRFGSARFETYAIRIVDERGRTLWNGEPTKTWRTGWTGGGGVCGLGLGSTPPPTGPGTMLVSVDGSQPGVGAGISQYLRSPRGRLGPDRLVLLDDLSDATALGLEDTRSRSRAALVGLNLNLPSFTPELFHVPLRSCDSLEQTAQTREWTRRAFEELHSFSDDADAENPGCEVLYGDDIDVFVLDTFELLGTSPLGPCLPLGSPAHRILASSARFKLLVKAGRWVASDEDPDWARERDAFFEFLGQRSISGVLLFGTDPRASAVIEHPTRDVVGYDLVETICGPFVPGQTSPAAPDPLALPGSVLASSCVFIRPQHFGLVVELIDPLSWRSFQFDRTANYLRRR